MVEQRLVKDITDRTTDTQLCQIQETEKILQRSSQTHEIGAQRIQEDLPGEEAQCQSQEIENQIDSGIQQRFFYAGLMNYLLFHELKNINKLQHGSPRNQLYRKTILIKRVYSEKGQFYYILSIFFWSQKKIPVRLRCVR